MLAKYLWNIFIIKLIIIFLNFKLIWSFAIKNFVRNIASSDKFLGFLFCIFDKWSWFPFEDEIINLHIIYFNRIIISLISFIRTRTAVNLFLLLHIIIVNLFLLIFINHKCKFESWSFSGFRFKSNLSSKFLS